MMSAMPRIVAGFMVNSFRVKPYSPLIPVTAYTRDTPSDSSDLDVIPTHSSAGARELFVMAEARVRLSVVLRLLPLGCEVSSQVMSESGRLHSPGTVRREQDGVLTQGSILSPLRNRPWTGRRLGIGAAPEFLRWSIAPHPLSHTHCRRPEPCGFGLETIGRLGRPWCHLFLAGGDGEGGRQIVISVWREDRL